LVNACDFLQKGKVAAEFFRDSHKCLQILGEAKTAEADSRTEKIGPDAGIESNAFSNLADIRARCLAQIGDHIDIGNLHGQEGIRGVLDDFSRTGIGHQKARPWAGRTG
jgi:hypothetical protein